MRSAGVVLAAGQSRRFGAANKLLADWQGKPLVSGALDVLQALPLQARGIVFADPDVRDLASDSVTALPLVGSLQSDSVKTALRWARDIDADRLLILLGDMPLITVETAKAVLALGQDGVAAVSDGKRNMPPASFLRQDFDSLMALQGDRGAGAVLKSLPEQRLVRVEAECLHDVDTVADLAIGARQGD